MKKYRKFLMIMTFMLSLCMTSMFVMADSYTTSYIKCGSSAFPKPLVGIVHTAFMMLQLLVPLGIIIVGSLDIVKAVTAQKDDEIEKGKKKLVKRFFAGIIVFFVFTIVKLMVDVMSDEKSTFSSCLDCLINGETHCGDETDSPFDPDVEIGSQSSPDKNPSTQPPSDSSNDKETIIRTALVKFAKQSVTTFKFNFIYLLPDERDSGNLNFTQENNKVVSNGGGSCGSETFKGNKCLKVCNSQNKCNPMYGTDCNGFMGFVIHNSLGIGTGGKGGSRLFYVDEASKKWYLYDTSLEKNFSFEYEIKTRNVKANVKEGDMIAYVCKTEKGTPTHIGMYVGNNEMVENGGWYETWKERTQPLQKVSIDTFLQKHTGCTFTLIKWKSFDGINENRVLTDPSKLNSWWGSR